VTWAIAGALTKWTGEKVAGAIVGGIAGKLFDKVLEAIGMGGPDLATKLDKISDQLVQVQRSLDRLTEMTAEILKLLAELKDFMEKSLKIETLVAAMTRIDVAYGSASDQVVLSENLTGRAISLRLLTEKMPHFDGITEQKMQDAAKEFATYVSDMPDRIATIQVALTKQAFGQVSLLTHWAKELAQQINGKKIGREAGYLVLEGYFLQAVAIQLKAVSVHCVALGLDRQLGQQFISDFIQDNYAKTMASQTAAFVETVEWLMFSTLAPTMPTGIRDEMSEREFPGHVDEILLRADLICAALNLVGRKGDQSKSPPSIQAAIQGIYGRALFRPSNLTNGKPPAIAPAGYTAAAGTGVRELAFPCLDLVESGGKAILNDATSSNVTLAHYFWPFPSPEPAVGKPIDPRLRGGVTPARYPVFGSKPDEQVLAAGLFDVSRLYRGLPSGAQKSYKQTPFPGNNDDLGIKSLSYTPYHHALTNDAGDAFSTSFTVAHMYRLNTRQHSYVLHPLFKYSGGKVKVRLSVHVASIIHRTARLDGEHGTGNSGWWEVWSRLKLRNSKGWEQEFFNSVDSYGSDWPISVNSIYARFKEPYDRRKDGFFSLDFDLDAADYELVLDNEISFTPAKIRYEGWHYTSLEFYLHGLSLERV